MSLKVSGEYSTPVQRRTKTDSGNGSESTSFITEALRSVLKLEKSQAVGKNTDFFSLGLDSHGVVDFLALLRQTHDKRFKEIRWRTIYENPTTGRLVLHIFGQKAKALPGPEDLIKKYSTFPVHVPGKEAPKEGEYCVVIIPQNSCVLHLRILTFVLSQAVTGVTGSLGAHILHQLIQDDRVKKIYCFVRKSTTSALATIKVRIQSALETAGGEQTTDTKAALAKIMTEIMARITVYRTDLSLEGLGLKSEELQEVQENVNVVIHNAWTVNYNMKLSSFEHLVKGTKNLIDLCLQSKHATPASFNFISSVAVASGDELPETHLESKSSMGYAQSKYVAEQLCNNASSKITARVLRLGQLVGDTVKGRWNAAESIPVIVRFSAAGKIFPGPKEDEKVFWLPVDVAARACVHLALLPAKDGLVFNVSNPKSISWNEAFFPALNEAFFPDSNETRMKLLPQHEWYHKFKRWGHELTEYIGGQYMIDDTAEGHKVDTPLNIITTNTEKLYPELGSKVVDVAMVKLFVAFWKKQPGWEEVNARGE